VKWAKVGEKTAAKARHQTVQSVKENMMEEASVQSWETKDPGDWRLGASRGMASDLLQNGFALGGGGGGGGGRGEAGGVFQGEALGGG